MAPTKNIVIVGAGAAGILTAQGLSKALDPAEWSIKLVSDRPFHIHYVAMIRAIVTDDGGFAERAINPLDRIFEPGRPGEVVIGSVTSVEDRMVNLEDGQQLPYDYLVLASGTTWSGPLTFPKTVEGKDQWIRDWRAKFAQSDDIVILGGGAVGAELAGELRYYYPQKSITLIHSDEYLLNRTYPDKFRSALTTKLVNLGIKVILNDRATPSDGDTSSVVTEKGQTIKADLVVPTWGGKRNTSFLKSFDSAILTLGGDVRVLPSLRVPLSSGATNVYAVGDIIDWPEQKQLAKVPSHVSVVVPNILASIRQEAPPKVYKGFMEGIALPAGPKLGIGYLPLLWGITIGDWLTPVLKSKNLFAQNAQQLTRYA